LANTFDLILTLLLLVLFCLLSVIPIFRQWRHLVYVFSVTTKRICGIFPLVSSAAQYPRQIMVQFPATALSGNDLEQVVHTNVPLFTKQYKLVPCEGFRVNAPYGMWQPWRGSNKQGEYCKTGLAAIELLKVVTTKLFNYFWKKVVITTFQLLRK